MLAAERVHDELAWAEILDNDFLFSATLHTDLTDIEIWSLVGSEKNIVVGTIFMLLEHVWYDVAAEMIITTRRKMASS